MVVLEGEVVSFGRSIPAGPVSLRLRGVRAILRSRGRLSRRRSHFFEKCHHADRETLPSSTIDSNTHFRSDNARSRQTVAYVGTLPPHDACVILGLFLVQMKRWVQISATIPTSFCSSQMGRFSLLTGKMLKCRFKKKQ